MEKKYVNPNEDFDFIMPLHVCEDFDTGFPTYDFTIKLYTIGERKVIVSKRGDVLTNCFNDNGRLHIVCNNHGLPAGELQADFTGYLPDALYPDGIRTVVKTWDLGITLDPKAHSCHTIEDVEVVVPYVYVTAYELAKRAGYQGTLEEYTEALNSMPEMVGEAKNVNAFMGEWAKGKQSIIKALGKWGMQADVSDSFDALSEKILDLPVRGDNDEGVISHTYNGAQRFDLLQELNNHQRQDYPYCFGVLFPYEDKVYSLRDADAYYTSDGAFYEEDSEHIFQFTPYAQNYIIYYFKDPTYLVHLPFLFQYEIVALNGQPRFNLGAGTCCELISYTNEKYDLKPGDITITSTEIGKIVLNGVESIENSNTAFIGSTHILELSLPSLKCLKNIQYFLVNNNSLNSIRLSSLKEILSNIILIAGNASYSGELLINLSGLCNTNGYYLDLSQSTATGGNITVKLGAPEGGWLYLYASAVNAINRIKILTVENGFRSYLRFDRLTQISTECLEAIIDNLGDNTEYETLQIVMGATNLAKVSDEKKQLAISKNYTLS